MGILSGKKGVVFGVANKRSIAWAIAQAWKEEGAELAFTYQGERLKDNVTQLAETFGDDTLITECDVTQDDHIDRVFNEVGEKFGGTLDLMLHSVAFAPKEALEGTFVGTTREAFRMAHDVSAYSLVALSRAAAPLMTEGGSIVAMSYLGAERVVPHYNVMGVAKASLEASTRYLASDLGSQKIRVNCISAGPVNTLAARGAPSASAIRSISSVRPTNGNSSSTAIDSASSSWLPPPVGPAVAADPTAATSPATSWPRMNGIFTRRKGRPRRTQRSRWFMAAASTLIRTSPGPGVGTGIFFTSTTPGPPKSSNTAARIIFGIS